MTMIFENRHGVMWPRLTGLLMAHTLKEFGVLAINLSKDERPNTPD